MIERIKAFHVALWTHLKRFRTWVFNLVAAGIVVVPDLIQGLASSNWNGVIPPRYMPLVTGAIIVVNILLRPRPARLKAELPSRRAE